MRRKVVESMPGGGLREVWVDLGPARALVGHGQPTSLVAVAAPGRSNIAIGHGRRIPARGQST